MVSARALLLQAGGRLGEVFRLCLVFVHLIQNCFPKYTRIGKSCRYYHLELTTALGFGIYCLYCAYCKYQCLQITRLNCNSDQSTKDKMMLLQKVRKTG